jgi:WD40 repeat protein
MSESGTNGPLVRPMSDIFISYSRKDLPFVRRLFSDLEQHGRKAWIDWQGIPPSAEWMQEIYSAIDAADTVIFVISPSSIVSTVCGEEIAHAIRHNKRLIPLVAEDVDENVVPKSVRDRNWIFFRPTDDLAAAFAALLKAIDTDLDWVRAHTRLLTRAIEWQRHSKDTSFCLRGSDLKGAELHLSSRAGSEPQLTPLQIEYVLASRSAATRRALIAIGAGALAVLAIGIFGLLFWQKRHESAVNLAAHFRERGAAELANANPLSAELLFAESLVINDNEEARQQLERARSKSPRLAWTDEHFHGASILAISPDGTLVAARSAGGIEIWDTDSRRSVRTLPLDQAVRIQTAAFSVDKRLLATSRDLHAELWDLGAGAAEPKETIVNSEATSSLVFSNDGKLLICGSTIGSISVWNLSGDKPMLLTRFPDQSGTVTGLAVSADDTVVVAASSVDALHFWSLTETSKPPTLVAHDDVVFCVALSPNGELVASGGWDHIVWIWDSHTMKQLRALEGHTGTIVSVAFSPDGKWLASTSEDQTTKLWDVEKGRLALTIPRHGSIVEKAAFVGSHAHGQLLAVSAGNTVQRWDLDSIGERNELITLRANDRPITMIGFSPHRHLVLASSVDHTVRAWGVDTRSIRHVFTGHDANVATLRISPDDLHFASASRDGAIRIWDLDADASQILRGTTRNVPIRDVAYTPDGTLLASGGDDSEIRIWSAKDGRLLHAFNTPADILGLAFSPDATLLASAGDDGVIRLWRTDNWSRMRELAGHQKGVYALAFSPDGSLLLSASADKTARLWVVSSGVPAGNALRHQSAVWGADFSPDGRTIVSGCEDATVHFWSLASSAGRVTATHRSVLHIADGPVWWVGFSRGLPRQYLGLVGQDGAIRLVDTDILSALFNVPEALVSEAQARTGLSIDDVIGKVDLVTTSAIFGSRPSLAGP